MAVISGKDGSVTFNSAEVLQVTGWTLTHTSHNSAWASSSTGGYRQRVAGVKDWGGSFTAKYDVAIVPTVGQSAALVLELDGSDSASGTAIIDSVSLVVDINTGEAVGYSLAFSGNGPLTMPS